MVSLPTQIEVLLAKARKAVTSDEAKSLAELVAPQSPLTEKPPTAAKKQPRAGDEVRFVPTPSFRPEPAANNMDSGEALRTVINDPAIKLTPAMMDLVNDDALVVLPSGEIAQRLGSQSASLGPRQEKKKTKSSKYSRTYRTIFRRIAPRYKMKNGKWKKDGFKTAVRVAHRETRKALGL